MGSLNTSPQSRWLWKIINNKFTAKLQASSKAGSKGGSKQKNSN
jgi:hypothetical protein